MWGKNPFEKVVFLINLGGMGSKWRKVKVALGMNLCVYVPGSETSGDSSSSPPSERHSAAALLSPVTDWSLLPEPAAPPPPAAAAAAPPSTPGSNVLKLSKSFGSRSSKVLFLGLSSSFFFPLLLSKVR